MTPKAISQQEFSPAWRELIAAALDARCHAHAPYSRFAVGAAVRTRSGRVYAGCNVENASSGLTVCAERVAIWSAVAQGEAEIEALVVVTAPGSTPCGACRQVMSDFTEDLPIVVADIKGMAWMTSLRALLPDPFPRVSYGERA